jgi:hypothetical protein
MANFGAHPAFLATDFAPARAAMLTTHAKLHGLRGDKKDQSLSRSIRLPEQSTQRML